MPDERESELFGIIGVPDNAEHWDARAQRVAAAAANAGGDSGLDWLARPRTTWLAASLLAVASLLSLRLPAERSEPSKPDNDWAEAIAPADDVGRALMLRDDPPPVGELLLGERGGT